MTPTEYLSGLDQLIRTGDEAAIMAFEREHLTDDLLDAMSPHERRSAASVTHVAARALGGGSLGPPTGVPVDDDDDDLADAVTEDSTAPARAG
jgi:hypothetical protein